jgi:hypothetical protein
VIALGFSATQFASSDATVNEISLILEMLYVSDLRELQDDVNDIIIAAQEFTADP